MGFLDAAKFSRAAVMFTALGSLCDPPDKSLQIVDNSAHSKASASSELHKSLDLSGISFEALSKISNSAKISNATTVSNPTIEAIRQDILYISGMSPEAVLKPENSHTIREKINELVASENGVESLDRFEVRRVLHKHIENIPELAHLARSKPTIRILEDSLIERIILANPRFNTWFVNLSPVVKEGYLLSLIKITKALNLVGIENTHRFDNARELLRNRYVASTQDKKSQLEDILGKKYFEGAVRDRRPICVLVFPEACSDRGGAFSAMEDKGRRMEAVDPFTSYYQVFYFEAPGDDAAISPALEIAQQFGEQAEMGVYAAHGQAGYMLYKSTAYPRLAQHNEILDIGDAPEIAKLAAAYQHGANIVLFACLLAQDPAMQASDSPIIVDENFARVFNRGVPSVNLHTADASTRAKFVFEDDGKFKEVYFESGNRVSFDASGTVKVKRTDWHLTQRFE